MDICLQIKPVNYKYNINRTKGTQLICFSHTDNHDTRFIRLELFDDKTPLSAEGADVTAIMVTAKDKLLLADNVECEVTQDGAIIIPVDSTVINGNSGDIKIEVRIEKDGQILTLPFPLWINVRASVVEDSSITDNTIGTLKSLLEENNALLERMEGMTQGKSAYEIAVEYGFSGSEAEWLESLSDPVSYEAVLAQIESANYEHAINKADSVAATPQTTTADHDNYPTVNALKALLYGNFYDKDDVDSLVDGCAAYNEVFDNQGSPLYQTKTDANAAEQRLSGAIAQRYTKPGGGIPKTDLASDVQTSLGKADTALQSHQDISGKYEKPSGGIPKSDLASAVQTSLGKADTALQSHQDISGKANASDVYTKAQVDAMLGGSGQICIVSSVSEMTDTSKYYVLESTGHLWAYTQSGAPSQDENLMVVQSSNLNKRVTTNGSVGDNNGSFICDLIPVDLTSQLTVTMTGFGSNMGTLGTGDNYNNSRISVFDAQQNHLQSKYIGRRNTSNIWMCAASGSDCTGVLNDFISDTSLNASDIKYVRFAPQISSSALTSADLSGLEIHIPTGSGAVTSEWADTGIALFGDRKSCPSYWESEVADTVQKIKALQDQYGHELLCFGWCSDMHIHPTGNAKEQYLGAVAHSVMKQCGIPLMLITGDMFSNSPAWTKAQTDTAYQTAWDYLYPIPSEKIMLLRGNHDAWFGTSDGQSYVDGLAPNEIYKYMFKPQAEDTRRVFGGDGSYFYLDDMPHKTRFICLNSQWADFTRDGTTDLPLYNTQKHSGYGQAQFNWLIKALDVPEDYSVLVSVHTPPTDSLTDGRHYLTGEGNRDLAVLRGILTAYCNKTTYTGSYIHNKTTLYGYEDTWADVSVSCDFSGYSGTLRGIFCGHSHYDQYTAADLPAPIICITCATDSPYDANASTRVAGTSAETAMDFVCLNTKTGAINLIRCGYGSDRTIS